MPVGAPNGFSGAFSSVRSRVLPPIVLLHPNRCALRRRPRSATSSLVLPLTLPLAPIASVIFVVVSGPLDEQPLVLFQALLELASNEDRPQKATLRGGLSVFYPISSNFVEYLYTKKLWLSPKQMSRSSRAFSLNPWAAMESPVNGVIRNSAIPAFPSLPRRVV
jgi:hypothetical protein